MPRSRGLPSLLCAWPKRLWWHVGTTAEPAEHQVGICTPSCCPWLRKPLPLALVYSLRATPWEKVPSPPRPLLQAKYLCFFPESTFQYLGPGLGEHLQVGKEGKSVRREVGRWAQCRELSSPGSGGGLAPITYLPLWAILFLHSDSQFPQLFSSCCKTLQPHQGKHG